MATPHLPPHAHESTRAAHGMIATPHRLATQAGQEILAEGGNALEAAIAAAAAIAVLYPHMNHLGGDGFWLIRLPHGRVRFISACGFAGAKASIPHYRDLGLEHIPARGPLAALTVPGAVSGWELALDAAHQVSRVSQVRGAHISLPRLLEPAIRYAKNGAPVSESFSRMAQTHLEALSPVPGFASTFLERAEDGTAKAPNPGHILHQPRLADTLEHLSRAGLRDFYNGDVGREIAADLDHIGSPVTREDLSHYIARVEPALRLPLQIGTLWNAPPPTQGLASLIILGLFERLAAAAPDGIAPESFAHLHGLVEATKQAFMVRDTHVRDPLHHPVDVERLLAADTLAAMARKINMGRALPWPRPGRPGDTIWLGAADSSGLVVSYIQSIYFEFGSGCVLPATGVLMQNRGVSFSLDPTAPHPLKPGRRPFHTLNPALAELKDGRIMAYGTMGGEGQPQTQAALFTRHVLFDVPLGEAIARPRWLLGRTWGDTTHALRLENGFREDLVEALAQAGHDLQVLPEAYSDTMGHAGAVVLHPRGGLDGAHDPRSDGNALGL
ncbi:gamma-glutamyltransferase family protein [Xanthobacter sp. TB0139]|uniref:gamma-glutamyltransferase family protein n=1 Tax=Xanthobacter sp. TB0139 TaxID=3459178 RepID=UPI004039D3CE